MIKKIILTIFIFSMLFSCGKKGDPEYIDPKKKAKIQNIAIVKI
jgi:hypothetical protein|tara:strand:+ start:1053 stop:1184 length:132 start_codon:yes stop_codon:yes gene_type:complete